MEREVVFSSYTVKYEGNNKPGNVLTKFIPPRILSNNNEFEIRLNRIINMSFSWFNINVEYNNQLIKFSKDSGSSFKNTQFPKGFGIIMI